MHIESFIWKIKQKDRNTASTTITGDTQVPDKLTVTDTRDAIACYNANSHEAI